MAKFEKINKKDLKENKKQKKNQKVKNEGKENESIKNNKTEKKKISSSVKFTILALILITIFCVALTPVTLQNDTYYTIAIGEHIVNHGVDMQDPFSWHEDLSYTYPHWLYDLITYIVYSVFGMTGIYISTCILSVILGWSIYLVGTKLAKNQLFSFFITIAVMYVIRGYIAARAQLVTFILFILTIFFIEKFLETKKKRYALGLIVIPILIANLHVAVFPFYFVLYLPYIAEYIIAVLAETILYKRIKRKILKLRIKILEKENPNSDKIEQLKEKLKVIEEKVDKIKIKRTKELQNPYKIKLVKNKNVKWLILVMVICLFTGLLTPLGDTPYTYLYKTMQGNTTQNINEHLPMTVSEDIDAICAIVIFLAILIFTKAKIRLSDLCMLGGLLYLMLDSRRQITMFAIIGSVILGRLLMELVRIYSKDLDKKAVKVLTNKIGIILITIMGLSLSYYFAEDKFDDTYIDETAYPVQACDYIIENIDLGTARFYNEYNYGSYMLFRGIPVFIDSRADLYAPEFSGRKDDIFMDFIDVSSIGTFYEDVFEKYDITHVITYENSKMNMIITKTNDPHYKQLYKDDYFVIYERIVD